MTHVVSSPVIIFIQKRISFVLETKTSITLANDGSRIHQSTIMALICPNFTALEMFSDDLTSTGQIQFPASHQFQLTICPNNLVNTINVVSCYRGGRSPYLHDDGR